MPRYANTPVKESLSILKKYHSQYLGEKPRKRIKMLIALKENTYRTRQELSDSLDVSKRSLERWITKYEQEGIEALVKKPTRNKNSKFIHGTIKSELKAKLGKAESTFSSYIDIQNWLKEEHNCDIKYSTLYYYLRQHFKTKLKVPRKSHVNKDDGAVAFIKNATNDN